MRAYKFGYDNGGNIIQKETYVISGGNVAGTPIQTDNYNYDTVVSNSGQNAAWHDQLKSYNGTAITYDALGNPLNYLGKVMTWQGRKLTSVDGVALKYDYNGLRIQKGDRTYYWQGNNLIMERWFSGSAENYIYYYYDESGVCGMCYNGSEYYYRKNIFGDVIEIYNNLGALQCRYVYDAWGNHKVYGASGSEIGAEVANIGNVNPIRYRGYYWDKETGLFLVSSRYYDPETGRFISPDDISYLDPSSINGLNLYAYCGNDPVNRLDPTGHSWESFWNGVGNWFADNWVKLAIGAAFIIGGAVVTFFTAGMGTAGLLAAGGALLASVKAVGISMAVSAGIGAVVGGITGGWEGALQGFSNGLADGFM